MKLTPRTIWLLAAALALAVLRFTPASAVPIATWDIANAPGSGAAVGYTAPDVTGSPLMAVGVSPWTFGETGFVAAAGWAPGLTPDPAKYFEWSVSVVNGSSIQFGSMALALLRGIQGANHGAQLWDLRASTDFFASSLLLQTLDISSSPADTQTIFNVNLGALGTQTGTVTFRLYGYDYTSPTDYAGFGNDSGWVIYGTGVDLGIDGTVIANTPEPGSLALVGLGLVLLVAVRRAGVQA
jgi:hypothetical protein